MTASTPREPAPPPSPPSSGGAGRGRLARLPPTLTTIGLVLLLAGVVALASHDASVWASPRRGTADRLAILATVAFLFAVGLGVAGAITFIRSRLRTAGGSGAPSWQEMMLRALPGTTATLVALSLLVISGAGLEPVTDTSEGIVQVSESSDPRPDLLSVVGWWDTPVKAGEGQPDRERAGGTDPSPAGRLPALLTLFGAVAAAVAGGAWWYVRRRRARRDEGGKADDPPHEAAHGAVMSTIDGMLADPDPQTAIIGAYARLLEGLAACGTPRRAYEGPMEHLHRVLTILHVRPGPLRNLIRLFEVARFSTHPLTSDHREQALDALRAVATDLAATSGPAPSTATMIRP